MPAKPARDKSSKKLQTIFHYTRPDGTPCFEIVRTDWNEGGVRKKECRVRYQDRPGHWVWQRPKDNFPYRLPDVLRAAADQIVFIVEGENKAEALAKAGEVATCNAFGQGKGKFSPEWADYFKGKSVVLLPDNDDVGKQHMARIWEILKPAAASIVYIEIPGLPDGGDVVDYFERGGTIDGLKTYIRQAVSGIMDVKITPYDQGDAYEPPADRKAPPPPRSSIGVMLDKITREEIKWLWTGRIPLGSITMLDGDPGCGKSNIAHYLAAVVSAGLNFPDGDSFKQSGVILIDVENGPSTTILPRIENNGGDLSRVKLLTTVPTSDGKSERLLSFPDDLDLLAQQVEETDAKLVIVDTIMNHLGGELQSRNDQDVRRALTPLSQLAQRMGFAVLILRHLNKSAQGPALYRGSGSIGFIGVARVGLIVGNDPDHPQTKILAVSKINDWKRMASLKYQLRGHTNGSSFVEWLGESDHDADGVLAAATTDDERSVVDEATDVLTELLKNGGMSREEIGKQAKEAGVSDASIRRAKAILGVVAYKSGFGGEGKWFWCLKEHFGKDEAKSA